MSKRKSPESVVVKFFYESPLDVAESLLAAVKDIVAGRRVPAARKRARAKRGATKDGSGEQQGRPTNASDDTDVDGGEMRS